MSNETLIPGAGSSGQSSMNSLYSRNSADVQSGTMVPGMQTQPAAPSAMSQPKNQGNSPVVGFLYSISNGGITEFWTLHLGTNTIGRSVDNDIQLLEASVSDKHASLSIKQMKSTGKVIASVRDTGSKNGMFINDEELDYDMHPCKNGDVLAIGLAYKLLLVLFNPSEQGLCVADNFTPVENNSKSASSHVYAQTSQDIHQTISLDSAQIDAGSTRVL